MKVSELYVTEALERIDADEAGAGEIIAVAWGERHGAEALAGLCSLHQAGFEVGPTVAAERELEIDTAELLSGLSSS